MSLLNAENVERVNQILDENFPQEVRKEVDTGACEIACSLAGAAAREACKRLPGALAQVCIVAANEAEKACKDLCD